LNNSAFIGGMNLTDEGPASADGLPDEVWQSAASG
jgi:hypothetical protein